MNTIGIFTGKQKDYNTAILTILYDNEPLTAWELTAKIPCPRGGRISLHSTLNKRLRDLEEKGYIRKKETKWLLRFKGVLTVLLLPREPKMFNLKWKETFENTSKAIEEYSTTKLGLDSATIQDGIKQLGLSFNDFKSWVNLAEKAKTLMENGVINFDVIKEGTLLGILILESRSAEELASVLRKKEEKK